MIRKRYGSGKLEKKECEICKCNEIDFLHMHHIIPRKDPRSSNNLSNLCIICSNCHNLVHSGKIIILGVFQSTAGRKLMWYRQGELPPIEEEHWKIHPDDNPLLSNKKKFNF